MVSDNEEVITTLSKETGLLKGPCDGESFTFYRRITAFRRLEKSGACKGNPPAVRATVRKSGCACAVLLQEKIPNPFFGPVRSKASLPSWVKYLHAIAYRCNDGLLGGVEGGVKFIVPVKGLLFRRKERPKWCHDVTKLGIVGNLVNEPKPASDVGG